MVYKSLMLFFFIALTSCGPNSETCNFDGPRTFDITDMNLETFTVDDNSEFTDVQRRHGENYIEGQNVDHDLLVFSLESSVQFLSKASKTQKHWHVSFISSAYACSPAPPSSNDNIKNIEITSSFNFNDVHITGEPLTEFFTVIFADPILSNYYRYDNDQIVYYTLDEYMDQDEVNAPQTLQLKLNTAPQYPGPHVFTITVTLDSGEIYELVSPEMTFN